jgi:biofilm protein TabA
MILDKISEIRRYSQLHPGLARAIEILAETHLESLAEGRHEWLGDRLFVLVAASAGRGRDQAKLEAHRKYIDIQCTIEGVEEIGWRPTSDCTQLEAPYDQSRDIMFFHDRPEIWLAVPPQHCAVFFPADAHAPLASTGQVLKAVIKVVVDWEP